MSDLEMYESEESNKESEGELSEGDLETDSAKESEMEDVDEKSNEYRKKKRPKYDDDVSLSEGEEDTGNTRWADALSKVLRSSDRILSKARKDADIKPKAEKQIEIVDASGKVVSQDSSKKVESKTYSQKRKEMLERQNKKAEWEAMGRVKPDITNRERERELVKIATRGVVYLFNTVEKHQKAKKGGSKKDPKKDKKLGVVKGNFMDILKDYAKKDKIEADPVVNKAKEEETWSILKDDFMMGAEMKDWDKESDLET